MKTILTRLTAIAVLCFGAASIANATSVGYELGETYNHSWKPPYLTVGSNFTLNNDPTANFPNRRYATEHDREEAENGGYIYTVGKTVNESWPEHQDHADADGGGASAYEWQGSNTFVYAADPQSTDPNDGIVVRNSGGDDGTIMRYDAYWVGKNAIKTISNPLYYVQAAVAPGANDTMAIGMLDNIPRYFSDTPIGQLTFDSTNANSTGLGQLWMSLSSTGEFKVHVGGDGSDPNSSVVAYGFVTDVVTHQENGPDLYSLALSAQRGTFDPMVWHLVRLEWDTVHDKITATIDDLTVLSKYSLGSFEPSIRGFGFQFLGETGRLDNFAATPEPSSMLMMCFGFLFFGVHTQRQRRRARKAAMAGLSLTG